MMHAIVAASARFLLDKTNQLWINQQSLDYRFWQRYLDVYDEVYLLVRAESVNSVPEDSILATGENIHAMPLPYFHGALQFAGQFFAMRQATAQYIKPGFAIHLRLPLLNATSIIGTLPEGYPFGAEVVGDPYDVFSPGAVQHPLRPFLRWWYTRQLKQNCAEACATSYVTEQALQRRYPPAKGTFSTHFSSIELTDDAFAIKPRRFDKIPSPLRLITVGSMDRLYKAQDVVIKALAQCRKRGYDVELTLIGDGQKTQQLKQMMETLGVASNVHFTGHIAGARTIREHLSRADLFVLPSRQEGLPRAMIEAMAQGLPCIGSTTGGFFELLPDDYLVAPDDVDGLVEKIIETGTHLQKLTDMAERNLKVAQDYHINELRSRRIRFYTYVREMTQECLNRRTTNA